MVCTRRTKTLVSTCVILSGMTNIVCLLYVGWITNYVANVNTKVPEPEPEKKFEDNKGETLKIIQRLDRLENVVNQHIQGKAHVCLHLTGSYCLFKCHHHEETCRISFQETATVSMMLISVIRQMLKFSCKVDYLKCVM